MGHVAQVLIEYMEKIKVIFIAFWLESTEFPLLDQGLNLLKLILLLINDKTFRNLISHWT